jgi:hypothetical protein
MTDTCYDPEKTWGCPSETCRWACQYKLREEREALDE